ncbi:hypothetical protein HK098_003277 [Nowakowskiella sp. JEL0407]|nr:hypothetical protein HK098_003277 [Nowakowskiella sp. JEL0407]
MGRSCRHKIKIGDELMSVQVSDLSKLKRIVEIVNSSDFPVWIDIVSVNQKLPSDKSAQVQIMDQIFLNAAKCYVLSDDTLFATLEFIRNRAKDLLKSTRSSLTERYLESQTSAMESLHSQSYFQRVWTLQELWGSIDVEFVCISNNKRLSRAEIVTPIHDLFKTIINHDKEKVWIKPMSAHITRTNVHTTVRRLDLLHLALTGTPLLEESRTFIRRIEYLQSYPRKATHTKDILHALYRQITPDCSIDYAKSLQDGLSDWIEYLYRIGYLYLTSVRHDPDLRSFKFWSAAKGIADTLEDSSQLFLCLSLLCDGWIHSSEHGIYENFDPRGPNLSERIVGSDINIDVVRVMTSSFADEQAVHELVSRRKISPRAATVGLNPQLRMDPVLKQLAGKLNIYLGGEGSWHATALELQRELMQNPMELLF